MSGEKTIEYIPLFPIVLNKVQLPEIPVKEMAAALEAKADHTTADYNGGWTSYFDNTSLDDVPGFEELYSHIMGMALAVANEYRWKIKSDEVDINIWANVMSPGGHHEAHIHRGSHLSGTFYVQRSATSAPIVYENPTQVMRMHEPNITETSPLNDMLVAFNPEPGDLLLWPSYLSHLVPKISTSETERRISISFNVNFVPVND